MNIKFVNLRNDQGKLYDSYTDYWKLVDLSGFDRCEASEIKHAPVEPTTYILAPANGNAQAIAKATRSAKCRMVCWSLERPIHGMDKFLPSHFDDVWVSDRWLAGQLQSQSVPGRRGNSRIRYVTLGGHPGLGGERSSTFQYDATHQAYIYGRRDHIVQQLQRGGILIGNACWGKARDEQLARSRVGLCLHQEDPPLPILEPLRFALFACWKLPLVAEFCHDFFPYDIFPLEQLRDAMQSGNGESNYRRLTTQFTFRACVEKALELA